ITTFGVRELAPAFLFWSRIPGARQVSTQEHVLWNLPFTKCKFCKSFLLILIHHWWGVGCTDSAVLRSPISYPLSHLFSFSCALHCIFCIFLHAVQTQLFCFQSIPHSLTEDTGVPPAGALLKHHPNLMD